MVRARTACITCRTERAKCELSKDDPVCQRCKERGQPCKFENVQNAGSRRACMNCHDWKVKCDTDRPACEKCRQLGLTCEYMHEPDLRGGRAPPKDGKRQQHRQRNTSCDKGKRECQTGEQLDFQYQHENAQNDVRLQDGGGRGSTIGYPLTPKSDAHPVQGLPAEGNSFSAAGGLDDPELGTLLMVQGCSTTSFENTSATETLGYPTSFHPWEWYPFQLDPCGMFCNDDPCLRLDGMDPSMLLHDGRGPFSWYGYGSGMAAQTPYGVQGLSPPTVDRYGYGGYDPFNSYRYATPDTLSSSAQADAPNAGPRGGTEQYTGDEILRQVDGKYHCPFPGCPKAFPAVSWLRRHYLSHTGEKPHVCLFPGCGARFSQAGNLHKHEKLHDGRRLLLGNSTLREGRTVSRTTRSRSTRGCERCKKRRVKCDGSDPERCMASKNTEVRSKHGCITCKQRRVKCDEGRPTCQQCAKGGRQCGYGGGRIERPFEHPPQEEMANRPDVIGLFEDSNIMPRLEFQDYLASTLEGTPTTADAREQEWQLPLQLDWSCLYYDNVGLSLDDMVQTRSV